VEIYGPITNSRGREIGVVRVGMTYKPARGSENIVKPAAEAAPDATAPVAPPPVTTVPPATDVPPAADAPADTGTAPAAGQ
jgi:hypothetical protein